MLKIPGDQPKQGIDGHMDGERFSTTFRQSNMVANNGQRTSAICYGILEYLLQVLNHQFSSVQYFRVA